MKTHLIAVAVLLSVIACRAWAQDHSPKPVPNEARVGIAFPDEGKFLLGESINLTFTLSNAGTEPLQFETGGDYRGNGFPLRYKVTVTDETGKALSPDLESPPNFGGLIGSRELMPGKTYNEPLRLQNYVRLDRPGVFTVQVVHDFGWKATPEKPLPVAVAKITITLPSAEESDKLVAGLCAKQNPQQKADTGRHGGGSAFSYLSHPVFLPALEKYAGQGNPAVMDGIHEMRTREATLAFVRLLSSDKQDVAFAAADFLSRRMPPRVADGYLRSGNWGVQQETIKVYSGLWVPEAEAPLRAIAGRLLESTNVWNVRTGAFIVETIGTPAEAPLLIKALGATMKMSKDRTKPEDDILDTPGAGDAIIMAVAGLRERGYRAPEGGGEAEIMVSFLELADPKVPRAKGWEEPLKAFITQSPPMLREAAVLALPKPPTGEWQNVLLKALNDKDRGVMRHACTAAGESKNPVFIEPLANIVRVERNVWVLREASISLVKLGAHLEGVDAWIERLGDEGLYFEGLQFLAEKLEHEKTGSSGGSTNLPREARIAMREKWQRFFSDEKRRDLVRAGKPVPVTEEEARDLFSGAFAFEYAGGREWPSRKP